MPVYTYNNVIIVILREYEIKFGYYKHYRKFWPDELLDRSFSRDFVRDTNCNMRIGHEY